MCLFMSVSSYFYSQLRGGGSREATSHLGEKMSRSANGVFGSRDLAVSTQKMEGSIWSTEMEPTLTNLVKSYLYGTYLSVSWI